MNALIRFLRYVFKTRPDGIAEEFAVEHHGCDRSRCCTICNRHHLPHKGCYLS